MSKDPEQETIAPRPPAPEHYRLHAPQLYPVWWPTRHDGDDGDWILIARRFMAQFRPMNPLLPEDCFSEVPADVLKRWG